VPQAASVKSRSAELEVIRGGGRIVGSATRAAQKRVQEFCASRRKSKREEKRHKALSSLQFQHVDLEAFWQITEERAQKARSGSLGGNGSAAGAPALSLRHCSSGPGSLAPLPPGVDTQCDGNSFLVASAEPAPQSGKAPKVKRRIAIVGGGPVGLWAATLIAQRHARKSPDAPEIVVFEQRDPSGHCSRKNVHIVLDAVTAGLLNKHVKAENFVSGMALASIEMALLTQLRRQLGKRFLEYNSNVEDPVDLLENGPWDLVLWAAGRRSLADSYRERLGCGMSLGDSDDVLVFEMRNFSKAGSTASLKDLAQVAASDFTPGVVNAALAAASQEEAGPCKFQVILRYAVDNEQKGKKDASAPVAWLWILGVPPELKAARKSAGRPGRDASSNLLEATDVEMQRLGLTDSCPGARRLRAAAAVLHDRVLKPGAVTLRWVEGSYWSSNKVVCALPPDSAGKTVPMLLLGDAALGKPFYTGTTLNMHISEVKALSKLPVIAWGNTAEAAKKDVQVRPQVSTEAAALRPYLEYERRYRDLVSRTPAFRRRTFASSGATVPAACPSSCAAAASSFKDPAAVSEAVLRCEQRRRPLWCNVAEHDASVAV